MAAAQCTSLIICCLRTSVLPNLRDSEGQEAHPLSLWGPWIYTVLGLWEVLEMQLHRCAKRMPTILTIVTRQMDSGVSSRTLTSQSTDFLRPLGVRPNRTKTLISSRGVRIPFQMCTKRELPPDTEHPMSPPSFSAAASTLSHGESDATLETALKTLSCYVVYKHRKQQLAGLRVRFICQSGC